MKDDFNQSHKESSVSNVFVEASVARDCDAYYGSPFGQEVDRIEMQVMGHLLRKVSGKTMLEFVAQREAVIRESFRVLKHGDFLTVGELEYLLQAFGDVEVETGVYFDEKFQKLDGADEYRLHEPGFIGVLARKSE